MMANPEEFRFFLPSVNGEDTAEATEHEGVMTEEEYSRYCGNVQNTGEWGGEPEVS
jgi:OTU domain-containing protein 6